MDKNDIENYDPKLQRQLCLKCGDTLFISGLDEPDTTLRGVDRNIDKDVDEKGPYVLCQKCGAFHQVKEWTDGPGQGGSWKIIGLRS